ncbi:MAG: glycosyltransferase family 4 protein [Terriglobales bacterium]|jgi:glycosyltransferase involved in cell wall biosynthesis
MSAPTHGCACLKPVAHAGMRILLIHQAFSLPNEPGGTRHYELAKRLVAMGHSVTIVTSRLNYLTGAHNGGMNECGIDMRYAPTLSGYHRNYVRRSLVFLSFMMSSFASALRTGPVDVVVGTSPSIFQAVSAWMVAAVRRRPFVLEIRDLWPEFAIDMGLLRNASLILLARFIERFLYRHANHIIVNSPEYRDYLLNRGIIDTKISVVSNGVDASMFQPRADGGDFRREHALGKKFVVMYAGALGLANDIECLLRAAMRLREDEAIVFVIVGGGKEEVRLRRQAQSMCLDNVCFVSAQPKERMPEILAAADVCVATLKDIRMFRMPYPNKVFDYMAAGRPTVLAIDGAIRKVLELADGGLSVRPGDDNAIAQAILKLRPSIQLRRKMGTSAREYVERHFNRDEQAQQLAVILEDVNRWAAS